MERYQMQSILAAYTSTFLVWSVLATVVGVLWMSARYRDTPTPVVLIMAVVGGPVVGVVLTSLQMTVVVVCHGLDTPGAGLALRGVGLTVVSVGAALCVGRCYGGRR